MKLLIINQFFYPDIAATAQLMTDLTEDLVERKVDVTVLTSHSNYLGGKLDLKRNGRFFDSEIIRVHCSSFGRGSFLGRFLDYFTFYILILIKSLSLPKFDVVLALTTPPLISFVGFILKIFKKSKFVCVIEDLYPDMALALGVLKKNSILAKVAHNISNLVYQHADKVIAISEKMKKKLVEKGVNSEKITVIDNWADIKQIYPVVKKNNWFVEKYNLNNKFIVQYSGNMGMGHDFETFLNGIRRLQSLNEIQFLFIGDGPRKEYISAFKNKHKLPNLLFLPYQERQDLPFSISAADVSLISLRKSLDGYIVPCKLYGILAAARPIIFVGSKESDIASIIRAANCGFHVDEGDVNGLVEKVILLHRDKQLVDSLGNNGFQFFIDNFERKKATSRYYNLLTKIK